MAAIGALLPFAGTGAKDPLPPFQTKDKGRAMRSSDRAGCRILDCSLYV